ncbi:MAG: ABC transporter ATP-binding protein [Alphaproteobacteria bacterium]
MLAVEGLTVAYGGLTALSHVSLAVGEGQFVTIVGPNGAGKTTLFKAISGTVPTEAGRIRYEERDLLAMPAAARAHLGIAHVPEGRQVFASMTVLENLEMGAYPAAGRRQWARNLERVMALFPVLAERRGQLAGTLSGGEQQMLAIGRGLASAPRLLMLDEPSMGLAPAVADLIFERIGELHREDRLTILLVEQRVAEAVQSCDFGYVLETGRVVLAGSSEALLKDDRIRTVYLGM